LEEVWLVNILMELGSVPLNYKLDFTIPEADNIGLFLSGGLDSCILLCLIIEELKRTNRQTPIHIFTCNKPPDPPHAKRMFDIISKEYNRKLIYHNNYDVSDEAKKNGVFDFKITRQAFKKFENIVMYIGGNNSWDKTQWVDKIPLLYDLKSTNTGVKLPWNYPEEPHITYPFLRMLKSQIIDIFYKLDKEHLMPYAYSCSKKDPPACNVCYSCEEAAMSFKLLDKIRPKYREIKTYE